MRYFNKADTNGASLIDGKWIMDCDRVYTPTDRNETRDSTPCDGGNQTKEELHSVVSKHT